MKIRNLKINKKNVSSILCATMLVGTMGGTALYYNNKEQVCETDIDINDIFVNKNEEFYCYFGVGEHIITVSRNDIYCYKSEEIEGYTIKSVEINGWRYNNKITYVNNVPVIVVASKDKNGQLEFNSFGVVSTEKDMIKK